MDIFIQAHIYLASYIYEKISMHRNLSTFLLFIIRIYAACHNFVQFMNSEGDI